MHILVLFTHKVLVGVFSFFLSFFTVRVLLISTEINKFKSHLNISTDGIKGHVVAVVTVAVAIPAFF